MHTLLKNKNFFKQGLRWTLGTLLVASLSLGQFSVLSSPKVEAFSVLLTGTPTTPVAPTPAVPSLQPIAPVYKQLEMTHTRLILGDDGVATATLQVKNNTGSTKDIEITEIHLPSGLTRLDYSGDTLKVTGLENGKTADLTYRVLVPKGQPEGVYPVAYKVTVDGNEADYTSYFRFVKSDESQGTSDLRISRIEIPERVQAGHAFDLKFYVTNHGTATLENVNVSIELPAGFINLSQSTFIIPRLPLFSGVEYTVTLKATTEVEEKFHDFRISATPASSTNGSSTVPASIFTGTYVAGGRSANKATGRVLVYLESFKFTDELGEEVKVLTAGKKYTLDFRIRNTSPYALRNVKLNFTESTGAITPNDASSSFYEASVPAGGYIFESLPILVANTAPAQNLVPSISLYFEYGTDQSGESTENFSVRVNQQTKVETKMTFLPPTKMAMQGDRVETNFNFINLGKTDLRNFRVYIKDFDSNQVSTDNNSVYIGNFSQGSKGSADFSLNFTQAGQQRLVFVLEYEEPSGDLVTEEYPVEYDISEFIMPDPSDFPVDPYPAEQGPNLMPWLVGLLIVAIIATVLVLRNIKKKKQQQSLEMDD